MDNILRNLVRIGTVSSIENNKARVIFEDKNMVSGWLTILKHVECMENDTVLVIYLPVFNGDGFILGVI